MQKDNKKKQGKRPARSAPVVPEFSVDSWTPKTLLGKQVKAGEVKDIDEILGNGRRILEPEITDALLKIESEHLLIGQSKGKFGGGQRRIFRQTQKKTREGNKPKFSTFAVVGDRNGHVGVGFGASQETLPAREKSVASAKMNMMLIRRGSGSWEDRSTEAHSIPFAVEGKCGSYRIILKPAPKGKGLICDKEVAKILTLAGVQNVWSKSFGQSKNKINVIKATIQALRRLTVTNVQDHHVEKLALLDGSLKKKSTPKPVVEAEAKEESKAEVKTEKAPKEAKK